MINSNILIYSDRQVFHTATSDTILPENARQSWNLKSFGVPWVFSAAISSSAPPICRTVLPYLINIEPDVRKTMFFHKESQSLHVKDSVFFFRELVRQLSTITHNKERSWQEPSLCTLVRAKSVWPGNQVSKPAKLLPDVAESLGKMTVIWLCRSRGEPKSTIKEVQSFVGPRASHSAFPMCSQCSRCNRVSICTTSRSVYTLNHENTRSSCCMSSFRCWRTNISARFHSCSWDAGSR